MPESFLLLIFSPALRLAVLFDLPTQSLPVRCNASHDLKLAPPGKPGVLLNALPRLVGATARDEHTPRGLTVGTPFQVPPRCNISEG
jgi:hypothetical protein